MTAMVLAAVVGCAVNGCTVGPDYHAPGVDVPAAFDAGPSTRPATTAFSSTEPVDLARWWESLNDKELNSLLARALRANLDLQIAADRLEQARINEAILTGNSLPAVEFSGAAARGSGTNSTRGRVSGPLNAGSNTTGLREITQVLGFDASWEVDLFGHLRRQGEAATADTRASLENRDAVLVTLLADVTRAYVQVRSLQVRLDILNQTIGVSKKTADIARVKLQRGMVNELDLVLAERQLATVQSRLAPLEAQLSAARRGVAVLLGQNPESLREELGRSAALPIPPAEVVTGLPGDLLRRRPDIRRAESQLIAANARIGVAASYLYPQILLTAGGGAQGQGLGRTPVAWNSLWSVGPAVRWSLLDFGGADAVIKGQESVTRSLLLEYRRTILSAVEEVDNALTNYNAERVRLTDLNRAVDSATRALDLATKRYDRGLTDFLNVLDAERQLFDLQDQRAVSEEQAVTQFIAVCKSLGGGWEGYPCPQPDLHLRPAALAAFSPDPSPIR